MSPLKVWTSFILMVLAQAHSAYSSSSAFSSSYSSSRSQRAPAASELSKRTIMDVIKRHATNARSSAGGSTREEEEHRANGAGVSEDARVRYLRDSLDTDEFIGILPQPQHVVLHASSSPDSRPVPAKRLSISSSTRFSSGQSGALSDQLGENPGHHHHHNNNNNRNNQQRTAATYSDITQLQEQGMTSPSSGPASDVSNNNNNNNNKHTAARSDAEDSTSEAHSELLRHAFLFQNPSMLPGHFTHLQSGMHPDHTPAVSSPNKRAEVEANHHNHHHNKNNRHNNNNNNNNDKLKGNQTNEEDHKEEEDEDNEEGVEGGEEALTEVMGSHHNNNDKRSFPEVVVGDDAAPWACRQWYDWRHLGENVYPSRLYETVCEVGPCYHGHYNCTPVTYTLHVLQVCLHGCEDQRVPLKLRSRWQWTDLNLTVGCQCVR